MTRPRSAPAHRLGLTLALVGLALPAAAQTPAAGSGLVADTTRAVVASSASGLPDTLAWRLPTDSLHPAPSAWAQRTPAIPHDSVLLAALPPAPPPPQDGPPPRSLHPLRAGLAAASLVGGSAALYAWEKSRWWDGNLAPFHFDDHLDYAANIDKAAHFYATDMQALAATEAFEWAGLDRKPAALAGAATAWLLQLQVEYHDGFYPLWGFDRYDVAANTLGAGWFVSRELEPELRRFDVRWGYVPRDPNPALWFNEDYQHHSYWVSARVWDLLPEPLQDVWPQALELSVGTAVADWDPSRPYETGTGELYVSVDLDYEAILPLGTRFGRSAADFLNRFHLPAPAIRLAPEPKVYLLFYGQ